MGLNDEPKLMFRLNLCTTLFTFIVFSTAAQTYNPLGRPAAGLSLFHRGLVRAEFATDRKNNPASGFHAA